MEALAGDALPLGILEECEGDARDAALYPGDVVLIYSDGFTEAKSAAGEYFGLARLQQALCASAHLPAERITTRFPTIYKFCLDHGLDITRSPIPVAPAAHYMMGGVKIDTWGRTSLRNLYACGEVACNAVHGANRLASNSLLESLVFAKRVVECSVRGERWEPRSNVKEEVVRLRYRDITCAAPPKLTRQSLQDLMWNHVGILRQGTYLLWAARILNVWERTRPQPTDRASHELANLVTVGRLVAEAALMRKESRGAHYRSDFPQTSPEWEKHIVLVKEGV